jgi:general secretion pathway protein E
MGVEPYLVASTVEGILAQRLIRLLCKHCKKETPVDNDYLPPDFPQKLEQLYVPIGCRHCRESGFSGRSGVHELLVSDPEVRHLCAERASAGVIRDYALKAGMVTLRQSGYRKVVAGRTTLDEVVRLTRGDLS